MKWAFYVLLYQRLWQSGPCQTDYMGEDGWDSTVGKTGADPGKGF